MCIYKNIYIYHIWCRVVWFKQTGRNLSFCFWFTATEHPTVATAPVGSSSIDATVEGLVSSRNQSLNLFEARNRLIFTFPCSVLRFCWGRWRASFYGPRSPGRKLLVSTLEKSLNIYDSMIQWSSLDSICFSIFLCSKSHLLPYLFCAILRYTPFSSGKWDNLSSISVHELRFGLSKLWEKPGVRYELHYSTSTFTEET